MYATILDNMVKPLNLNIPVDMRERRRSSRIDDREVKELQRLIIGMFEFLENPTRSPMKINTISSAEHFKFKNCPCCSSE